MTDVQLTGVPETMLWTLHNRASEAMRRDGILRDPRCVEIYRSIPYDYVRSFGHADGSHALRSVVFDKAVREFTGAHPNAVVVNLGEGLETQRFRVTIGDDVLWITVDLPEAITARERFISPDASHRHVAASALDHSWMDAVPQGRPVLVTAQGLFMYFREEELRELTGAMAARWSDLEMMFDHIPRWLSRRSMSSGGWRKTAHYRVPPLPWGINRGDLPTTLRSWMGPKAEVTTVDFGLPRGVRRRVADAVALVPWCRDLMPGITRVRIRST
jgi:O-methyltransferase involved in polyketide biosynthesis